MEASPWPELTSLIARDLSVAARPLLALPDDVGPGEVEALAVSRFPGARWQTPPSFGVEGELRLSRHSFLRGPYAVTRSDAAGLGLPTGTTIAFDLHGPRERGAPPWLVGGDRDGLKRVFADGMPVRDEERVMDWLIAAARRLGGSVRIGERSVVLTPDPQAVVDLTVYSDVWLEPEAALLVVQQLTKKARLETLGEPWSGPADPAQVAAQLAQLGVEPVSESRRAELHAAADAADLDAMAGPVMFDGYAVIGDLGYDGDLVLEAGGEEAFPLVLAALDWAQDGVIAYRVAWGAADPEEAESERPSMSYRVARGRALRMINAVTVAVHRAVGGEIVDEAGFLVAPEDLEEELV